MFYREPCREKVVCPFGYEHFMGVFEDASGFGLGVTIDGLEDPIVLQPFFFDMVCYCRAGLLDICLMTQRRELQN